MRLRWGMLAVAVAVAVVCAAVLIRPARSDGTAAPTGVVWRVPTGEPDIALTFDDGPDPTFTPQMLQLLRAHGARGTFFVLGSQAARYPAIVRAEAAEGSEVCNHGWGHAVLSGRTSAVVTQNVARTRAVLQRLGIPQCGLFRFPYFASDAAARQIVEGLGYRIVGASVDTLDWRRRNPRAIAQQVLEGVRPGDIVLLHDGGGPRARSVQALALILDGLPERGLRAVTVSQLLASAGQGAPAAAQAPRAAGGPN